VRLRNTSKNKGLIREMIATLNRSTQGAVLLCMLNCLHKQELHIMFGLTGVLGALVRAILYALIVFIVILVIVFILQQLPIVAGIGTILGRFALPLAVLAGAVTFFSLYRKA
jgi:hypothetical protein